MQGTTIPGKSTPAPSSPADAAGLDSLRRRIAQGPRPSPDGQVADAVKALLPKQAGAPPRTNSIPPRA